MTATQDPPRTRRRSLLRRAAVPLLLLSGLVSGGGYLFREELGDEWELRRFRQAAANDDPNLAQHRERLLKRFADGKRNKTARLAEDPDPKVRSAAVDVLLAGQPKAKRAEPVEGLRARYRTASWGTRVQDGINRLLTDSDDAVRQKTLRGLCELEWVDLFADTLRETLKSGSPADRALVAETLTRWDASLLRTTIADATRPDEVRIAAMRGMDIWGSDESAAFRGELRDAIVSALESPNPDLRNAAVGALRHADRAPGAWLDLLCDDAKKELHPLVLKTWIDALGAENALTRHWYDSHLAWPRPGPARRSAISTHVLCEGAKRQIQHLTNAPPVPETAALADRDGPTGRAFQVQLNRLGYVLSVANAARWYCDQIDKPPTLSEWLPHEAANGAPPVRPLNAYVFREAKPVWEWCLTRRDGYPTRFLNANSIVENYGSKPSPHPIPVRPLGAVLDELLIDQAAFDRLQALYDPK